MPLTVERVSACIDPFMLSGLDSYISSVTLKVMRFRPVFVQ